MPGRTDVRVAASEVREWLACPRRGGGDPREERREVLLRQTVEAGWARVHARHLGGRALGAAQLDRELEHDVLVHRAMLGHVQYAAVAEPVADVGNEPFRRRCSR